MFFYFVCVCVCFLFLYKYFPFQRVARVLSTLNLKIFSLLHLVMDSSSDKISSFPKGFSKEISVLIHIPHPIMAPLKFYSSVSSPSTYTRHVCTYLQLCFIFRKIHHPYKLLHLSQLLRYIITSILM